MVSPSNNDNCIEIMRIAGFVTLLVITGCFTVVTSLILIFEGSAACGSVGWDDGGFGVAVGGTDTGGD